MEIRKSYVGLVVAALTLSACGGEGGGGGEGDITLRAGHLYNPDVPVQRCGFAELAESEALSEVGITIDTVDSSQLGTEQEMLEQASQGQLDITLGIGSTMGTVFNMPQLEMFEAYYLYDSVEEVTEVHSSDVAQEIWDTLEDEANLKRIGDPWLFGERHIFGSVPVQGPEDLQGADLRVGDNNMSLSSAEGLGANSVSSAFSEVYLGLQQGVFDLAEASLNVISAESFNEVSDYVSLTSHLFTGHAFVVNLDRWDSLSDEQQEVLEAEVADQAQVIADCLEEDDQEALQEWEEAGTPEIITDVDREAFAELAFETYSEGFEWSEEYVELLEELGRR